MLETLIFQIYAGPHSQVNTLSPLPSVILCFNMFLLPTHIKGNILDLVLSNAKISVDDLAISSPYLHKFNTDHFIISFHANTTYESVVTKSSRYVFDYGRVDLDGLCSYLCWLQLVFVWTLVLNINWTAFTLWERSMQRILLLF